MSNTPDFGFDETPSTAGAQTFTDPQGGGEGGGEGDEYAVLNGQSADLKDFEGKSVKCIGFAGKPRVTKPNDRGEVYAWITFTACEPPELAGRTDDLGGVVMGGEASKRQKTLEALAKLCRQAGATWDPQNLGATMAGLKKALEDAGSTIKYTLAKGKQGGTFVNL